MIRIQKLKAKRYYVDAEERLTNKKDYEDYLKKDTHIPAQFVGELYPEMKYDKQKYEALIEGKDPNTYENILSRESKNAGYDIVVSMPKSYSMLYAAADDELREQLNKIQQEVVKEYLQDASKMLRPAGSRDEYKNFDPEQTKTVAAEFWHIENRNLEPHVHAHLNLFNAAEFTMENGEKKVFAINAQELYYRQKEMNAELNNRMCDRLNEIGIKTISTKDGYRIVGVTEEQEKLFSTRTNEITEFIEEQKAAGKYYSSRTEAKIAEEQIRNETKEKKPDLNSREILELQQQQLLEKGITLETIKQHQAEYQYKEPDVIEQDIIRDCTRLAGVVSETELRRQLLDINRDLAPEKRIKFEDFCRRNELVEVQLSDQRHKGFTTNEIIITEIQNVEKAKSLAAGEHGKLELSENAEGIKIATMSNIKAELAKYSGKMNEGQEDACYLIAKPGRIALIEGDAGTGKTTTAIKFANDYYAAQGYEVVGLATQGKTSQSLADAGIQNTQNLSQFFAKEDQAGSRRVLIVDEAGMTGAEQYRDLLKYAEENPDTKLIFVGDQKQLSSVAYGTTFENIRENLDENHQRRLWENMRQATQEQKAIAEAARDRQPEKVLENLKATGDLHETKDRQEAIQQLAKDYAASEAKTKVALAHTNADVNAINDAIRQELAAQGKLDMSNQTEFTVKTGQVTETRSFAEGDQIILTGKYKKQGIEIVNGKEIKNKLAIENGTEATIKKIDGEKITLTTKENNRTYVIDTKEFKDFNHGYCLTTHKSQGITVQESFIYANGTETANRNYVNMSRHKEAANLYITEDNKERYIQNAAINDNKINVIQDQACQQRYTELKENRPHLLVDPYSTKNQIQDIQHQIAANGINDDLQTKLDQMHRLDNILHDLQKERKDINDERKAYQEWKVEKAAERGQWQKVKEEVKQIKQEIQINPKISEREKALNQKEEIVKSQIQTVKDIKGQLKEDIERLQQQKQQQYGPRDNRTKEEVLAEFKTSQQAPQPEQKRDNNDQAKALADIQRQIALDELKEREEGQHIMTPMEAARRQQQINQLEKIGGKEAEATARRLEDEIKIGTRQQSQQQPQSRESLLSQMARHTTVPMQQQPQQTKSRESILADMKHQMARPTTVPMQLQPQRKPQLQQNQPKKSR